MGYGTMKVFVFADVNWAVGRVNRDIAKALPDCEFKYLHWGWWSIDDMQDMYNWCDVMITNVVELKMILTYVDPCKILFISHGYLENECQNLPSNLTYGMTSESIRLLFPLESKVFLTPNGVDPSQFDYIERNGALNIIGWCGNPSILSKQATWIIDISKESNTILNICSETSCEDDLTKWSRLDYNGVRKWYSTIDVLIVTSIPEEKHETGPLSAFEAIVSGIPVIGTSVGNFKNVPGPKFTNIEEAVEIINHLKSNPEEMKTLAKEQYEYVIANYTYNSFAHKWREALQYVVDLKNQTKLTRMKVFVFADDTWSLGRVHHDVARNLPDVEFTFSHWSGYDWQDVVNKFNDCDVCLAGILCVNFFKSNFPYFDRSKCLFVSHGQDAGCNESPDTLDLVYGYTSQVDAHIFSMNKYAFLTPNGVDSTQFDYIERDGYLNKLGWCAAPHNGIKQIQWAINISKQTEVELSIAGVEGLDISKWNQLSYDGVRKWYSTIDLFLVTSHSDTGPLPPFEAIVSGVPAIGTRVGNFQQVPGPKFDTIEEAIEIVNHLKSNPEEMKTLAKEQYHYVMNNWTYAVTASKWRAALQCVIDLRNKVE